MASRLALPLLLAVLALAAWLLFAGDEQGAEPEPAERAATSGALASGVPAGEDASEFEASTERTAVDDSAASAGSTGGFDAPGLGIPSFTGRVLRGDGSPAAGAEVTAIGLVGWSGARDRADRAERLGADWKLLTRADGRFVLPEPPRDGLRFEIVISDPEHAPLRMENLPAWPGRTRDLGDLALARGFSIAGRVTSPGGDPVAGAVILAYPDLTASSPGADLGQVAALGLPEVVTDREGGFVLDRLGPGRVRLRAESEAGFSPWSAGVAGAEGERVEGLELQLLPIRWLEGAVLNAAREGLAEILVRAEVNSTLPSPNRSFRLEAISAADGSFRFALPAALRQVQLSAGGEGTWVAQRGLNREEEFSQRIELVLQPMPALAGVVLLEPTQPAAGVRVALASRSNPGQAPEESAILAETLSAEDGSFALRIDLSAADSSRFRVVAWDEKHQPAMSDSIRLRPDGRGFEQPELVLVLREGLELSGRALTPDGSPVSGARALLRKLSAPRNNRVPGLDQSARGGAVISSAATAADGGFRFTGLLVGDYRVELHHRAWSPSESEDLPVIESLADVEVRMAPISGILGEVEGDLSTVPALQVSLRAPGRDPLIAPVDALGGFSFSAIAPDLYSLELLPAPLGAEGAFAFPEGTALGRLDGLEVTAGEQVPATIRLNLEERGLVLGEVRSSGAAAVNFGIFLVRQEATSDPDPRIAARNAVRNMRATQTDLRGRFLLGGVETGDHLLIVCAPGQWPSGLWNDDGNRDPRGLSRRQIRVEAGREARCDFMLRTGTLRITVENGDQNVVGQQAELTPLATSDDGHVQSISVGRQGAVTGPLPSGPYTLSYGQDAERRSWQVFIPADSEGLASITLPERPRRD